MQVSVNVAGRCT